MKQGINFITPILTLCFLLSSAIALAAGTGTALKNDKLRSEPYSDADTIGQLNRGETIDIIKRKGAWLNIKTETTEGWVRLMSVKRGKSGRKSSASSDALKVASGRAGTGKVVATTGVRGLSAKELKTAKFNAAEIKKLESNTLTKKQGAQFAKQGGLKAIKFATLKEAKGGQ